MITELAKREHNVTVYAMDEAGNTASQTIYFTVADTFPTLTVIVVSRGSCGSCWYFGLLQKTET